MTMDVSSVIDSFGAEMTLTRFNAGHYDEHGRYVEGSSSESTIVAEAVPATPRDLQVLPEGLRTEGSKRFFSKSELKTASAGEGGTQADQIKFEGSTYELQHVEDWNSQGGFWVAIGVRMEQ